MRGPQDIITEIREKQPGIINIIFIITAFFLLSKAFEDLVNECRHPRRSSPIG
jgi:hypothetical protein